MEIYDFKSKKWSIHEVQTPLIGVTAGVFYTPPILNGKQHIIMDKNGKVYMFDEGNFSWRMMLDLNTKVIAYMGLPPIDFHFCKFCLHVLSRSKNFTHLVSAKFLRLYCTPILYISKTKLSREFLNVKGQFYSLYCT
jgi:hypothetical protein